MCRGTAHLRTRGSRRALLGASLGSASFTIAERGRGTVRVALNQVGRAALRAHRRVTALLALVVDRRTTLTRQPLTLTR